MKKANGVFIGLLFIVVGLLYACSALDLFEFSIFFPGWWTLFIIVPCLYALTRKNEDKTGPVIGLVIGLCFLINAQNFRFHIDFWPMAVALLCIIIGWKLIVPKKKKENHQAEYTEYTSYSGSTNGTTQANPNVNTNGGNSGNSGATANNTSSSGNSYTSGSGAYSAGKGYINASAIFGGKDIRVDNECFTGAEISVVMGAVDLDLRNAIISEDVYVTLTAIMGGVDIYAPANVRVVTDGCSCIMGGIDVNTSYANFHGADAPRLIITGTCIMGGVDIK